MTSLRDNCETVRLMYRRFSANDVAGILELLTPDYELLDIPTGHRIRGREAFRQWMTRSKSALPDASADVRALYADRDVVVAEVRNRATHTGTLVLPGGVELTATGRRIDMIGCEILRLREGRIAYCSVYYDSLSFARQLGQIPPER